MLHGLLDPSVVEGGFEVCDVPVALEELTQLILDKQKNFSDLAVGQLCRDFERAAGGRTGQVFDFVLSYALCHDPIIETERVRVCLAVGKFATVGLNPVRLTRTARVVEPVLLRPVHCFLHDSLVFESRIFLVNEALGWTCVLLHVAGVELSHNLVEIVFHYKVFAQVTMLAAHAIWTAADPFRHKAFKLSLQLCCLGLELRVAELASNLAGLIL